MPATFDSSPALACRAVRLTPHGSSALAVVRLIGPRVEAFLSRHFSRTVPIGRAVHGQLTHDGETLDDPIIARVGMNSIDISLHGSPYIVEAVLALARSMGFATADVLPSPTDFPDAEDLWRDVLATLPHALTPLAVRALLAQPQAWAGVTAITPGMLADRSLQSLLSLPTIAIVGPANVGKSTLANTLFGQQRSIVADLPGTTRDWVGGIADIDGLAVTLLDTPGVRDTADPIERAAQSASAGPVAAAHLVVVVVDHSTPLTAADLDIFERHPKAIRVANKSDRGPAWNAMKENAIETVATTDAGVASLRRAILDHFGCLPFEISVPRFWTDAQRNQQ